MKSTSKKRTPTIENSTVKRRYLTGREVERLVDCARKHGRYGHRDGLLNARRVASGEPPNFHRRPRRGARTAQGSPIRSRSDRGIRWLDLRAKVTSAVPEMFSIQVYPKDFPAALRQGIARHTR